MPRQRVKRWRFSTSCPRAPTARSAGGARGSPGSLAKLGMKYRAHVAKQMPILEDVLAGIAILVERGTDADPCIRLDTLGLHTVGTGSSQEAVVEALGRAGCKLRDVDRYATEMHNPEVTEPAGSGDVPTGNYRLSPRLACCARRLRGARSRISLQRTACRATRRRRAICLGGLLPRAHGARNARGYDEASPVHGEGEPVPRADDGLLRTDLLAMMRELWNHPAASLESFAETPIVPGIAQAADWCAVPMPSCAPPK